MVLAVPCGMSSRFISIIHFKSFDFIVMQLADRISILIKGFFSHDRQKAFMELPATPVVFFIQTMGRGKPAHYWKNYCLNLNVF